MFRFTLIALLLPLVVSSQGLKNDTIRPDYSNMLRIQVVDVIEHNPLSGCTITISDSLGNIEGESTSNRYYITTVKPGRSYTVTVSKPGYADVVAKWTQPKETADAYVDIYMHKSNMTKREKKRAYRRSQKPLRHIYLAGATNQTLPPKTEMLLWYASWYKVGGTWTSMTSGSL